MSQECHPKTKDHSVENSANTSYRLTGGSTVSFSFRESWPFAPSGYTTTGTGKSLLAMYHYKRDGYTIQGQVITDMYHSGTYDHKKVSKRYHSGTDDHKNVPFRGI